MTSSRSDVVARAAEALAVPLAAGLGIQLIDPDVPADGVRFTVGGLSGNGAGGVHASALAAAMELAGYLVVAPTLAEDEHAVTHANALQLMSGAGSGEHVEVTAFLDKRGKRIAFVAVSAMCGDRPLAPPAGPGTGQRDRGRSGLVLLTHGAGGGVHSADLDAVRAALTAQGVGVGLVTQPYRFAGRRTPPKPEVQDAAWRALLDQVGQDGPLIVGGRSNGARVACRTALAVGAVAVVALAFPLHPPGRPEKSRLAELDASGGPPLVVQGARDPFGMPPSGLGREVVVVAGDHALTRDVALVASSVVAFVTSLRAPNPQS